LDTYQNNVGASQQHHPIISAMVNNGSLKYDNDKDGKPSELANCEAQFRNKDYETFIAIRYQNYKLTVIIHQIISYFALGFFFQVY
jgi:hypothetical protein